jgi:hypothetical protein
MWDSAATTTPATRGKSHDLRGRLFMDDDNLNPDTSSPGLFPVASALLISHRLTLRRSSLILDKRVQEEILSVLNVARNAGSATTPSSLADTLMMTIPLCGDSMESRDRLAAGVKDQPSSPARSHGMATAGRPKLPSQLSTVGRPISPADKQGSSISRSFDEHELSTWIVKLDHLG